MNRSRVLICLFVVALESVVSGADLSTIDRSIRKEPPYLSGAPKYGMLVFGEKAETRIWLVLDIVSNGVDPDGSKNALYIDRNGNGDLTEPGEKVSCTMRKTQMMVTFTPDPIISYCPRFEAGEIVERDGKTKHEKLVVELGMFVGKYRPCTVSLEVAGRGSQIGGGSLLRLADRPGEAPILHFNGPLTMRTSMGNGLLHIPMDYDGGEPEPPWMEQYPLVPGEPTALRAELGTPGLGRGTFVSLSVDAVPAGVHPVAVFQVPHRDAAMPPTTIRIVLKRRCCGTLFYDDVKLPDDAAPGKAKVVLSFPDWKAGRVTPATADVDVGPRSQ